MRSDDDDPASAEREGALAAVSGTLQTGFHLAAVWGGVAPFVGPAIGIRLDSSVTARLADHAIPGAIAVLFALWANLGWWTSPYSRPLLRFVGVLAGVWMIGAHVPLLRQAMSGLASWRATAFHTLPGVFIVSFGGLLMAREIMFRP